MIDLGDELVLCTPFRVRQLTEDSAANPNFNLNEAEFYQSVFTYLCGFGVWSEPRCCQITLNATAAKFHLQPMAKVGSSVLIKANKPLPKQSSACSLNSVRAIS